MFKEPKTSVYIEREIGENLYVGISREGVLLSLADRYVFLEAEEVAAVHEMVAIFYQTFGEE